MMYNIIIILKP